MMSRIFRLSGRNLLNHNENPSQTREARVSQCIRTLPNVAESKSRLRVESDLVTESDAS